MKLKQYLISAAVSISAMSLLAACNGGNNSGPQSSANYGQVVNISPQQLNVIESSLLNSMFENTLGLTFPKDVSYSTPLATGTISIGAGNFGIDGYMGTNSSDTTESYNFNPLNNFLINSLDMQTGQPNEGPYANNGVVGSVSAYAIKYLTPGQNADTDPNQITRTASGLVIVPNMLAGESAIKGVVVYFHPTTPGKNQVPSCLGSPISEPSALIPVALPAISSNVPSYCTVNNQPLDNVGAGTFAMLASVFADNGYIVVAPDYVGQGSDYDNVHPYVAYPENNVYSAFNMFPAMRQILTKYHNIPTSKNYPLFITGYSEGGGYALKAAQMAQGSDAATLVKNNLTLKITSPQEGAYSLKDQMDFAFADLDDGILNCDDASSGYQCGQADMATNPSYESVNSWNIGSSYYAAQGKPVLTSYVLTAVNYYTFHNLSTAYNFTMNTQFWSDIPIDGNIATLYQLYSGGGTYYGGTNVGLAIVNNTFSINSYDSITNPTINIWDGNNVPSSQQLGYSRYGVNNAGSLYINPGVQTNPDFQKIIQQGTTYNWQTQKPINFIHMKYDSLVTVLNSKQAISCMTTGKSFTGDSSFARASAAPCSTAPSASGLIQETLINNNQISNNSVQMTPDNNNYSGFWVMPGKTSPGYKLLSAMATATNKQESDFAVPFDHGDMFILGSIAALCTFENQLESNPTNSAFCPDSYNPPG